MSVAAGDINEWIQRDLARKLISKTGYVRAFSRAPDERLLASKSAAAVKALDGLAERGFLEIIEPTSGDLQCRLTAAGRRWILELENPRVLLEDLVRISERQLEKLESLQRDFDGFRDSVFTQANVAAEVLAAVRRDLHSRQMDEALLVFLSEAELRPSWTAMTLESLYQQVRALDANATIGQFHDVVRSLHACGRIRLSPWTGPLYQLPEPSLALLIGHEVLYYVELQRSVAA